MKNQALDKIKSELIKEFKLVKIIESNCMQKYQQELEKLIHEKMARLEELRLIQADIQMVYIAMLYWFMFLD